MRVWTAHEGLLMCDGREIMLRRDYRTTYDEGCAEIQWIADACNAAEQRADQANMTAWITSAPLGDLLDVDSE